MVDVVDDMVEDGVEKTANDLIDDAKGMDEKTWEAIVDNMMKDITDDIESGVKDRVKDTVMDKQAMKKMSLAKSTEATDDSNMFSNVLAGSSMCAAALICTFYATRKIGMGNDVDDKFHKV